MALSKNSIQQGDCIELFGRIDEGSVDLVFADPPFNIGYEYDVYDDSKRADDYLHWCQQWIKGAYRALKSNGTFWLAIGDEYAAELKIEAQKAGFHCRSWVIWYYTFGVNCVNGFSRSHTHLFHFVKDKKHFTFNRFNPTNKSPIGQTAGLRRQSSKPQRSLTRQHLDYSPTGCPLKLSPNHDTWYLPRVAGTFKEREGFHGCQMPEQLLARIIRASSHPQDLVLDPFGGSGTTMCVAKKLGRRWMGFELSTDYVSYINERLDNTTVGDSIDGAEDPIQSAPSTIKGKRRKKPFDKNTEKAVIAAYEKAGRGYPVDYMICDRDLNKEFVSECLDREIGGSATIWNRFLLQLRKAGKLPRSTKNPDRITSDQMDRYGFASEVAWRLLAIDYRKTLDDILCSPEFAAEFDRLAVEFGPTDTAVTSLEYRRAAISIRKRSNAARNTAAEKFSQWMRKSKKLPRFSLDDRLESLERPGVFVLSAGDVGFYAGESDNVRVRVEQAMNNPNWRGLEPDSVSFVDNDQSLAMKFALKSALARRERPLLNCRLLVHESELSHRH